jgi:guanylate kinase
MDGANGAMLVIISGPSGVGKDTIIDALKLRSHDPEYHYVVTCTTRARRPGEVDGRDYLFLDKATFAAQRAAGEFLEANNVHGNWYGTPRGQVREALAGGRDVILKIDVQGAQVVKEKIPGALLVFLIPPSLEDLFVRLRSQRPGRPTRLELRQRNAAMSWLARRTTTTWSPMRPARSSGPPSVRAGPSPRSTGGTRIAGSTSTRDRLDRADARLRPAPDERAAEQGGEPSRSRAGPRGPDLHLPRPGPAARPRAWRGGPRRIRATPGARHRRGRRRGEFRIHA